MPVLRLERSVGNAKPVLVANTDLPVLRSLAPELMLIVEARVTLDMSTLTLVGAGAEGSIWNSTGAADMVYFDRCVTWLQLQPGPSDSTISVYDYFDRLCFGAVPLILHQLWFPPQQVLFALALSALVHNTSAPASTRRRIESRPHGGGVDEAMLPVFKAPGSLQKRERRGCERSDTAGCLGGHDGRTEEHRDR